MSVRRPIAPRRRSAPSGQEGDGGSWAAAPQEAGSAPTADGAPDEGVGFVGTAEASEGDDSSDSAAGWSSQPVTPWRKGGAGRGRRGGARPKATGRGAQGAGRPEGSRAATPHAYVAGRRLSLRGLGLILVVLVAFAIISPTLRHMVEQQEQLRSVSADLEEARARTEELERRQRLWADPDYVRAQARDRLGYVVPGERAFVVVDPQTITGKKPVTPQERAAQAARERAANAPWYVNLWESAQVAGTSPVPGEEAKEVTGAPADEITPPPGTDQPAEYPTSMEEKKN